MHKGGETGALGLLKDYLIAWPSRLSGVSKEGSCVMKERPNGPSGPNRTSTAQYCFRPKDVGNQHDSTNNDIRHTPSDSREGPFKQNI